MVAYLRASIDGTLFDGAERFSTSFALARQGDLTPEPETMTQWCNSVMALLAGSGLGAQSLRGMLSSRGSIQAVRLYYYTGPNQPVFFTAQSSAAAIPGVSTAAFPPQCTLVLSLLSTISGKRYRGRMYWPHIGGGITTGGKSTLAVQSLATNVAGLLADINGLNGNGIGEIVVHSTVGDSVTPVTRLSVGDVIDTQRRRRDAMIETRYVAPV